MTTKRIIYSTAIGCLVIYGPAYGYFAYLRAEAIDRIGRRVEAADAEFQTARQSLTKDLPGPSGVDQFTSALERSRCTLTLDTTIKFLVFKERIQSTTPDAACLRAAALRVHLDHENGIVIDAIRSMLKRELGGVLPQSVVGQIEPISFVIKEPIPTVVRKYYPEGLYTYRTNEPMLAQLDQLGSAIAEQCRLQESANRTAMKHYERATSAHRGQLPEKLIRKLQEQTEQRGILTKADTPHSVPTSSGESVQFVLPSVSFDEEGYDAEVTAVTNAYYANNSLSTAAQPYADCFGSNRSCDGWGCSSIQVRNGGDDVVVTIKGASGKVVRHAYIRMHGYHEFELPNGSYQPFFYSGTGWNPEKVMKVLACGKLKGGFVSNEEVGKDDKQYLSNSILTYSLIKQTSGNFTTRPSSTSEAL